MNKITMLAVIGFGALVFGVITPESGLMASPTGNNNGYNGNNNHDDHGDDNNSYGSPKVKMYKVIISNDGNPTPSAESFGLSANGRARLSNGTKVTLQADTPAVLTEAGLDGYEFVEIRGDGNCPENIGGHNS